MNYSCISRKSEIPTNVLNEKQDWNFITQKVLYIHPIELRISMHETLHESKW